MLDPNLNIFTLLFCVYVMYGFGYVLGFVQGLDEDKEPVRIVRCVVILCLTLMWPFVKGVHDGEKDA